MRRPSHNILPKTSTQGFMMAYVLGPLLLICLTISSTPAQAENDYLMLAAEKAPVELLLNSIYLDITRTGNRFVTVGERGLILVSNDMGHSWQQAEVPVSTTLTAVFFPSSQKGWAVGHDGVILHTANGGYTWIKQLDGNQINLLAREPLKRAVDLQKAELRVSPQSINSEISATFDNLEYLLTDWIRAVEEGPSRPWMGVWFADESVGIAIGTFGLIFKTTDGGRSWYPLIDRVENPEGYHYYGITHADGSLYLTGEGGMLFRSEDIGETWIRLPSPAQASWFGIISCHKGLIAFGLQGSAFRSMDRGLSWRPLDTIRSCSLSGGTVLGNGGVLLIGMDGVPLYSSDHGTSFQILNQIFPGASALVDKGKGLALVVGLNGLAEINTNGF